MKEELFLKKNVYYIKNKKQKLDCSKIAIDFSILHNQNYASWESVPQRAILFCRLLPNKYGTDKFCQFLYINHNIQGKKNHV